MHREDTRIELHQAAAAAVSADSAARGYRHALYAAALGMAERVLPLPACGGHLLARPVATGGALDACGAYPVFSCREPAALADDLHGLASGLVSVTLVADPLLDWAPGRLEAMFPVMRSLGPHFVIDLQRPAFQPSSHHRRSLRKAAAHNTEIRIEADPAALLDEWTALYAVLVQEVGITGMRRFSRAIFERMLAVPGGVIFTAWDGDTLLGADWYFEDGDRVYAHMSAYAQAGYARAVSYPLMDAAWRHFAARGARLLTLGGVPLVAGGDTGLALFKQGWSTHTQPSWLCGRVLDAPAYERLCTAAGRSEPGPYFPLYRQGEFS